MADIPEILRALYALARGGALAPRAAAAGALAVAEALAGDASPALLVRWWARADPRRLALVDARGARTFAELDADVDALAAGLVRRGLGRGSRTVVALANCADALLLPYALARAGGASLAVSPRSTAGELDGIVRRFGADAIFFSPAAADAALSTVLARAEPDRAFAVGGRADAPRRLAARGARPPHDGSASSLVLFTSGTTGAPRGAVRGFRLGQLVALLDFVSASPMRHGDVHLAVSPLHHATAYGFALLTHLLGSTLVVEEEFEPARFLDAIARHRVAHTAVVPTMLHRLAALPRAAFVPERLATLRAVFTGGAPLTPALAEAIAERLGEVLYNFYGSTETGLVTLATPHDLAAAPGTIGRAVPGSEIRLLDEHRLPVKDGELGELFVKNALVHDGYLDESRAGRAAGFVSVGDLALRDAAGRYHLVGRARDVVNSGGEKIVPAEVEAALQAHPAVVEAAVAGVPDAEWGERVEAWVVRGAAVSEAALRAFCRERLAAHKVPKEIHFVAALPRNAQGKILRRELARASYRTPRTPIVGTT